MDFLVLPGESCFTASEAQKLQDRINKLGLVTATSVRGTWVYYAAINSGSAGAREAVRKLHELLPLPSTSSPAPHPVEHIGYSQTYHVTPRNISPWSSKATSIAHVCGLRDAVARVERGRAITVVFSEPYSAGAEDGWAPPFRDVLYDRMTEALSASEPDMARMFVQGRAAPLEVVDVFAPGADALEVLRAHNAARGLALDPAEMEYLVGVFAQLGRPPTDVELFMFAQVNSEHCRHKQFNARWTVDGMHMGASLFDMIRATHRATPDFTVSAYSDNAAVLQGEAANFWAPDYSTGSWRMTKEVVHLLAKVETHNHPTAISPFPGAATGSGGEIRDEGAVGRGSTPRAGLAGFWTSDLLIPDARAPWEADVGRPAHFASALDIMLEAPIGSARFNNEFGRPCLLGVWRTLLTDVGPAVPHDATTGGVGVDSAAGGEHDNHHPSGRGKGKGAVREEWRGYHKPIMIAGGVGTVRPQHALKRQADVREGAHAVVLGGPAMLIGLGGGAASSKAATGGAGHLAAQEAKLDFDSVQRGNAEVERRCQMVIDACTALGEGNPIAMIHDVGAGGLSNALPELVKDAGFGGRFELRQVDSADASMSPLQIWCNEAQERYVVLVNEEAMNRFVSICRRERCGFSDVGRVVSKEQDGEARLLLTDRDSREHPRPIDLPMAALFPAGRRLERIVASRRLNLARFHPADRLREEFGHELSDSELLSKAVQRVFLVPSVGSKSFLITIGDRTVGGLTVRDQMVGPWQTPVADVAVSALSFGLDGDGGKKNKSNPLAAGRLLGSAMAMGERPSLALIDAAASARMAVAEALTNLGAAHVLPGTSGGGDLRRVKLSANWMAAVNHAGEGAALYEAVRALGEDLCPRLELAIPVGKDSTSMKASWRDAQSGEARSVTAPVSVVITAFAPVKDVRSTWTPQLRRVEDVGESLLMFVDLAAGKQALGGSALAQSLGRLGDDSPDVRDADLLRDYADALWQLHEAGVVLAYHDRSDGGLATTLAEMMFAGRVGVDVSLDGIAKSSALDDVVAALFNEELGAVFQVRKADEINFIRCFATCGPPPGLIRKIGTVAARPRQHQRMVIYHGGATVLTLDRATAQGWWARTSFEMQRLRDDPACARAELDAMADPTDPGLSYDLTFNPKQEVRPMLSLGAFTSLFKLPRVAILREQGVNGHAEMAFAFRAAGFDAVDVHMTDVLGGRTLADFVGLACCGGFSYGDVLGGGVGWAKSILMHEGGAARQEFERFFRRPDTFTLGVCNGCQMLSRLRDLIPGAEDWPVFEQNVSRQFEARFSMVKVRDEHADSTVTAASMAATFAASVDSSSARQSTDLSGAPPPLPSRPTTASSTTTTFPASSAAATDDSLLGFGGGPSSLPPSVFLHGMSGSSLPIAVSHGEGRADFSRSPPGARARLEARGLVPIRYVDTRLRVAAPTGLAVVVPAAAGEALLGGATTTTTTTTTGLDESPAAMARFYPANPNGSPAAIAAVRSRDGRVLAMMPHPERSVLADCASWTDPDKRLDWGEFGPWVRLFKSARRWVG